MFQVYHKKHETVTDNKQRSIYVNKIENRVAFKIETGYVLELLTLKNKIKQIKTFYLKQ